MDIAVFGSVLPGSYDENLENTRLGVTYLLGNMKVDTNYVNLGLGAGFSVMGAISSDAVKNSIALGGGPGQAIANS